MQLRSEEQLLLAGIKINPSQGELEHMNNLIPLVQDWDYLTKLAIERGLGPLLHKKLPLLSNSKLVPDKVKNTLHQVYYKTFSRNMVLSDHFRKIAEAFSADGISVIALKGIYLAEWLYQDIGLRQLSDIDLLVKEKDAEKCIRILEGFGFEEVEHKLKLSEFVLEHTDKVHLPQMILNGVSVEIHTRIHKKKESFRVDVNKLWTNALPASINGVQVNVFHLHDLLIHLCLHLDKHFHQGDVNFTSFADITNILDKYATTFDWATFSERCRLYNCGDAVFKYIVLSNKYLNSPVPDYIKQKYDFLITEEVEQLFIKALKGEEIIVKHVPYFVQTPMQVKGFTRKIKFIVHMAFPSKEFMVNRFDMKYNSLYFLYYPCRFWVGIKAVGRYLYCRKS